jgi:hypothetical protein
MRSLLWLLVFVGLAGCSLAGEPKFYRPLPSSDVAVSDGAVVNDGEGLDVVAADGAVTDAPSEGGPDGGAACVAIGPEVCNGLDDDCDGRVDNVIALDPPLDCVLEPMGDGGVRRLGAYRGCACQPAPRANEICGNSLDDNGNGRVDEDCECNAIVVPATFTGIIATALGTLNVFSTVDAALAALPAGSQRTVCLLSSPTRDCSVQPTHNYNIRVPANVTIRGGYVPGEVLLGSPRYVPSCRARIAGTVEFVASNVNSVVTNVHVSKLFSTPGSAVSMPGDGWFVDSQVEGRTPTASPNIVGIEATGNALHRVVRNVSVVMQGNAEVTALFASRGRIWVDNLRVDIESGQRSVAIDLEQVAPSVLDVVTIATLNGAQLTEAVRITDPQSYVALRALTGSAGPGDVGRGVTISCMDGSRSVVQVANANWEGSLADDSIGALVRGCHAEFSAPTRDSLIASSSSISEEARDSVAVALRCELGARCITLGGERKLAFRALSRSGSVGATQGAAIVDRASAVVASTTFDATGSTGSSTGFEMDGQSLVATHSMFIGGASTSPDGSRALQIKRAIRAIVVTSVLRAARGIGASIAAGSIDDLLFFSNTVTAVAADPNVAPSQLVVVRGAHSPASIRFENNLLACSNLPISPPITAATVGLRIDGTSPFRYFGYNMIGGCQKPVVMAEMLISDAAVAQRRLGMDLAAGALRISSETLAIDLMTGWKLTRSSPAISQGSPAALGPEVLDFEGQLRGPLAPADIGADEL